MAARPADAKAVLSGLADYAHKVCSEFANLLAGEDERASQLLGELEQVIVQFKRLRPPPVFTKRVPRVRMIEFNQD